MRRLAVLLTVLAGLALAPPAPAQAPADERANARQFAESAYRLRVAVLAQKGEIERRLAVLEQPACARAVRRAPERAALPLGEALLAVALDALVVPAAPAFATFQAELDAVPTGDPALRSGRAAWRSANRLLASIPTLPADLCAQLDAWRRAGYREAAAPRFDLRRFEAALRGSAAGDRKLERAEARLRELGVSRGAAKRFAGDTLYDGIAEDALENP